MKRKSRGLWVIELWDGKKWVFYWTAQDWTRRHARLVAGDQPRTQRWRVVKYERARARREKLDACLDRIERRLREGVAPGKPWGNEHMALQIVREERNR